ncbi:MAG: hypothetical protein GY832_44535 [Chloroflexi bacterium]|nr:hypothetical protein [Chloroflexota bacterium]
MTDINGLPLAFFVIAGGIILVLAVWLLMRFGRTIAKTLLTVTGLVIGLVIALAVLAQGAASLQTATAAKETAEVAKTAATGNLLLVGALGCVGGVSAIAVLALAGVAVYLWYKVRITEQRQQRPAMLPQVRPTRIQAGDDLNFEQLENWVEKGEELWQQNDQVYW